MWRGIGFCLELIEEPALVNPIQATEEQRRGRAFVWLPGVEPGKGSLFVKGYRARAFEAWAPIGFAAPRPKKGAVRTV